MHDSGKMSSTVALSTGEAVVATAVVCVVCSFTAGLLVGVLLTQCVGVCGRRRKRGQTEIPPVYEDITLEKTPANVAAIELNSNEAYGKLRKPIGAVRTTKLSLPNLNLFTSKLHYFQICSLPNCTTWRARPPLRAHILFAHAHFILWVGCVCVCVRTALYMNT